LKIEGKRETNEHGQTVYRGYQPVVDQMFRAYIDKRAFAPLVSEFRKWNWEWNYDNYLRELTAGLHEAGHWSLLKELWGSVIAKRRTNYNKTRKARGVAPERVSEELVAKTRDLLLDSLYRLRNYASELHQESEIGEYLEMIARVEQREKA
jgi:hypothetical protein